MRGQSVSPIGFALPLIVVLTGCGTNGTEDGTGGLPPGTGESGTRGSGGGTTTSGSTRGSGGPDSSSAETGDSQTSSGSASAGTSDGIGTDSASTSGGTEGGGPGDTSGGNPGTGPADTASSTGVATAGDTSDGPGVRFDVGSGDTDGVIPPEPCGCGEDAWSYIWVANSAESTVSKIDTRTATEVGRYYTRADADGNPSRTSVSLGGRAVAVANRNGGVVKIWAREEFCDPMRNGQPGLQTGTGATPLPFEDDDCIAWVTPFDYTSQRPIAWAGIQRPDSCDDGALWTSGCDGSQGGAGIVTVHRLDGQTGAVDLTVEVPEITCDGGGFGAYGGAVDPDGNFWIGTNGRFATGASLVRIDYQTGDHVVHDYPADIQGYGITVDNRGRPWISSWGTSTVGRFDPGTGIWETAGTSRSFGGIQQGEDGRIWVAIDDGAGGGPGPGVAVFDPETLASLGSFPVGGGMVKGISLDVDGFVWAVTNTASKFDAGTFAEVESYGGLNGPYTYSDMTGWALQNANCNPPPG